MKNKNGNVAVIVIIILIVTITASAIIWFVSTRTQEPARQTVVAQPESAVQAKTTPQVTAPVVQPVVNQQGIFESKDMGIKFKIPNSSLVLAENKNNKLTFRYSGKTKEMSAIDDIEILEIEKIKQPLDQMVFSNPPNVTSKYNA
jgi:hypothetical protein